MIYIGIDCGLDGAIAVLDESGRIRLRRKMPTVKVGKGRKIDLIDLETFIQSPLGPTQMYNEMTYAIEDPGGHAPSAAGLRSMTYSFAVTEAFVSSTRERYDLVRALEWQRTFWKKPKMPKGQKFDTKAAALTAARKLWPKEDFLATERSSKPHEGIVDALLIAEHIRRKLK